MDNKSNEMSSKLFDAVVEGDMENAKVILAKIDSNEKAKLISEIQVKDGDSRCSVNAAICFNKPEIVEILLEDISPTQRESIFVSVHNSQSSFHLAAEHSTNSEIILTMLETLSDTQMMRLLSIPDNMSWTPLDVAAYGNKNSDIIKALLGRCSVEQRMTLLCMMDKVKWTPIHLAARYNENADVMRAMLESLDREERMTLLSMNDKVEWTPVHEAARCNENADVMRAMLETLASQQRMTLLCMKTKYDWTPVHGAAGDNENADVMRAMLETLDIEQRMTLLCMTHGLEWTPVNSAARNNENPDVIRAMLETLVTEQRMTLLSMKTKDEWTPVHLAARHNENADVITAMLETLDTKQRMTLLCMKNKDEWTPVHLAVRYNKNADVMRAMLEALDVEQRMTLLSMKNKVEWTPVHLAVSYNKNADVMRAMLETLDIEHRITLLCMKTKDEWTPVHLAAGQNENADVMRAMLETLDTKQRRTLLFMKKNDEWTPVHLAARYNKNVDVMRAMLEALDIEQRMTLLSMKNKDEWTPVHLAVSYNENSDVMRAMLETLDTEQRITLLFMKNNDEWTPVHSAARYNKNANVMRAMLETLDTEQRMTSLCMKTKDEWTPVHLAARNNENADVMRAMLETLDTEQRMTLLCMKTKDEWTPVHLAAGQNENADVMRAMLETLDTKQRMTLLFMRSASSSHLVAERSSDAEFFEVMLVATKIQLINMKLRSGTRVMEHLIPELDLTTVLSFLSEQSKHPDPTYSILLLIVAKTGNIGVDCALVESFQSHNIQFESLTTDNLLKYMEEFNTDGLCSILEYLATERKMKREHHILLWMDKLDNNLLHLAASVSHTKFIRKILCSQDNHEINQALQRENNDGLTPYDVAKNKDTQRLLAWSQSQAGCYPLPTPPQVVVFYASQDRPGADTEKNSFIEALEALNIVPQVIENPAKQDIYDIIRANQTHDISGLIVVIMSHGNRGTVTVSDGDLPINKILLQMNPVMLEGIPKILILQACQGRPATGRMLDCGTSGSGSNYSISQSDGAGLAKSAKRQRISRNVDTKTESDNDTVSLLDSKQEHESDAQIKSISQEPYTLKAPDMAVLSATVDKQTATRNLLIPILAEHLEDSDKKEDLIDVFRKTIDELRSKEPAQVPECRTTMRYKICLHKVFRPKRKYKRALNLLNAAFFEEYEYPWLTI